MPCLQAMESVVRTNYIPWHTIEWSKLPDHIVDDRGNDDQQAIDTLMKFISKPDKQGISGKQAINMFQDFSDIYITKGECINEKLLYCYCTFMEKNIIRELKDLFGVTETTDIEDGWVIVQTKNVLEEKISTSKMYIGSILDYSTNRLIDKNSIHHVTNNEKNKNAALVMRTMFTQLAMPQSERLDIRRRCENGRGQKWKYSEAIHIFRILYCRILFIETFFSKDTIDQTKKQLNDYFLYTKLPILQVDQTKKAYFSRLPSEIIELGLKDVSQSFPNCFTHHVSSCWLDALESMLEPSMKANGWTLLRGRNATFLDSTQKNNPLYLADILSKALVCQESYVQAAHRKQSFLYKIAKIWLIFAQCTFVILKSKFFPQKCWLRNMFYGINISFGVALLVGALHNARLKYGKRYKKEAFWIIDAPC